MANLFAADLQIRSGDYSGAITRLVDVTKNEPDNARAHYFLGLAFDRTGNSDQAEKEWREAARLRPDMVIAQEAPAKLAIRTGNVDLLAASAEQLIKLQPSAPNGYLFRAGAENSHQQPDKAEADIATAIRLAPQSASGYLALAKLRFSQRKLGDALSNFQLALDRDPQAVEALSGLAQTYIAEKQPANAIAAVNAQITKHPNVGGFYYILGALQVQNRDLAAASASFQKAVELDSGNFPALFQTGKTRHGTRRPG